ncbi:hypothetical protein Lesp02_02450 [Lentzea sp. NBRC 105346]|uniref:DUF3040 domain-containing protein n=1 Tax=Lentzea sp. NBRC 105346 TaxID=3032205 RepID=UPI0024A03A60|nr:DUF3040 domain-containing protein [Lentzea sp. NBRC 105346]GLZ28055.1 hypothetical protein Lesp02_02450 [Lentzea sp. NBRC 105346]
MGLAEYERRQLDELEQRLTEDDPRLAARLTNAAPAVFLSRRTRAVVVLLASYVIGLVLVIMGVTISSVVVIVLGAAITTSLPVATFWRAWRRRRQSR